MHYTFRAAGAKVSALTRELQVPRFICALGPWKRETLYAIARRDHVSVNQNKYEKYNRKNNHDGAGVLSERSAGGKTCDT